MGISLRTIERSRTLGYDAIHLREEGLQRLPDPGVWAKARDEVRIVLTSDLDFGYLAATSHAVLPSVILFRLGEPGLTQSSGGFGFMDRGERPSMV